VTRPWPAAGTTLALSLGCAIAGSPVKLPLAVADPAGRVAYTRNADDGIDAFDLSSGRPLWSTTAAFRPLLAIDSRLLALNEDRVLGFDSRGEPVFESEPLAFPDWVSVRGRTAERSDNALEVEASTKDGLLVLRWSARLRHAFGISVGPDQRGDRSATGTADVDLETGRAEIKEGALPPPAPSPPPLLPPSFHKRPGDQMYCQLGRGGTHYGGEPVPFRTGSGSLALLALAHEGSYTLRLERWNAAGQALAPIELHVATEAPALSVDLDRSHLLIHGESRTRVVSLETGALVGRLPSSLFAGEIKLEHGFAVLGKRLIYVAERREPAEASGQTPVRRFLRAVDLKSGQRAWERPVRGFVEYPPVPGA